MANSQEAGKKQVNVSSPEEASPIVAHEHMQFSNGNYDTKSSKLADEDAKCWVVFERSFNRLFPHFS